MSTTPSKAKQHPTRRALLKTGAHAAWAVPAVQVVSAVNAYAAPVSGGTGLKGSLKLTHDPVSSSSNPRTVLLTVENTGSGAVKNVSLTVSGTGVDFSKTITATGTPATDTWSVTNGAADATALYSGQLAVSGKLTVTLSFTPGKQTGTGNAKEYAFNIAAKCEQADTLDETPTGDTADISF